MAYGWEPWGEDLQPDHTHFSRHRKNQQIHPDRKKPVITKEELVDIVDTLYRSYNDQLPNVAAARKKILEAWWTPLKDFTTDTIKQAIRWRQIHQPTFLPKPMEVAITAQDLSNPDEAPPTTAEAWKTYLDMQTGNTYGNWTPTKHHPALQKTITTLATAKLNPQSPRDREFFTETYQQNVTNWRHQTQNNKPG